MKIHVTSLQKGCVVSISYLDSLLSQCKGQCKGFSQTSAMLHSAALVPYQ